MPHGDGDPPVKGVLTIHGVTKEVLLEVEGLPPKRKTPTSSTRTGATTKVKQTNSDSLGVPRSKPAEYWFATISKSTWNPLIKA